MRRSKRKWIQSAIKKPGALRSTAKRMGLIKGDEPLGSPAPAGIDPLVSSRFEQNGGQGEEDG